MMFLGSSESADKSRSKLRANDIRKQILQKYMHRTEEGEKSTSEMSEKSFDNLYEEALSPRARSPMFDSKKLERMEKELAADRTRLHNVFGRIFFYLNCIFGIKYFFLLPLTLIHNGGWYFLVPLFICTVVLAMPLVFLELALGQFTSQLVTLVFSRISPIAVGIGLMFPTIRVLLLLYFKTEHRNVSLLWDMVQKVFFRERNVVCWEQDATDCWIPKACPNEDDVFFQGGCYNREYLWKTRRITSQQNVRLAAHGLFQNEEFYSDAYVRPVPHVDRIMNAEALSHRLDSTVTFFFVAFLFSLLGVRRLTKAMPFFHVLLALALMGIVITMAATASARESFSLFFGVLGDCSDISSIIWPSTWYVAAAEALTMLAIGDGTLYALGALNHFNNNLVKDLWIIMATWFGLAVFSIPFFGTVIVSGITTEVREETTATWTSKSISALVKRMQRYPYQETAMHPLYYFQWADVLSQYSAYALFIIFFIVQIPAHVLMAENMVTIVVRLISGLQGLNKAVVRHCVMFVYYVLMATVYHLSLELGNKELIGYAVCFLVLAVACWECLAVRSLYTIGRILVNVETMFKKHPPAFRLVKSLARLLYFLWGQLIPPVAGILFILAMLGLMRMMSTNLLIICLLLVAFLPVYVGVWIVIKLMTKKAERVHTLFRPNLNWGPFTVMDKKNANYDERAARLFR